MKTLNDQLIEFFSKNLLVLVSDVSSTGTIDAKVIKLIAFARTKIASRVAFFASSYSNGTDSCERISMSISGQSPRILSELCMRFGPVKAGTVGVIARDRSFQLIMAGSSVLHRIFAIQSSPGSVMISAECQAIAAITQSLCISLSGESNVSDVFVEAGTINVVTMVRGHLQFQNFQFERAAVPA